MKLKTPRKNSYLTLSSSCVLKRLEKPALYNIETDELYELDEAGFNFLKSCAESPEAVDSSVDQEFIKYCLAEGILTYTSQPIRRRFSLKPSPTPSLRYLLVHLTEKCNLRCRHCLWEKAGMLDISLETLFKILHEFEEIQGLHLILSGGEPLLYKEFWSLNERLPEFSFRTILLSNGMLISRKVATKLKVHEVQISLDGLERGHDILRGKGSFRKALRAVEYLKEAGIDISIATMIHRENMRDFPALEHLIRKLGAREWSIDLPIVTGRLRNNKDLLPSYKEAAPLLKYSFGSGPHVSSGGYACGAHLAAVMADGLMAKCGFFLEKPLGHVREGIYTCWKRLKHLSLDELKCKCQFIEVCRGGCRYRALLDGDILAPDLFKCAFYEVDVR